jgi:hypothetical protein
MEDMTGIRVQNSKNLEIAFDQIFEKIWEIPDLERETQKNEYLLDARAAIRAINLKLMIAGI